MSVKFDVLSRASQRSVLLWANAVCVDQHLSLKNPVKSVQNARSRGCGALRIPVRCSLRGQIGGERCQEKENDHCDGTISEGYAVEGDYQETVHVASAVERSCQWAICCGGVACFACHDYL